MASGFTRPFGVLAPCCVLVAGVMVGEDERKPPALKDSDVQAVEITVTDEDEKPKQTIKSTDAKKIGALISVIVKGKATKEHKCADTGEIKLKLKGGKERRFGILAGHHAEFYEYRYYNAEDKYDGIFKVDRKPFLKAMTDLGITKLDLGEPE